MAFRFTVLSWAHIFTLHMKLFTVSAPISGRVSFQAANSWKQFEDFISSFKDIISAYVKDELYNQNQKRPKFLRGHSKNFQLQFILTRFTQVYIYIYIELDFPHLFNFNCFLGN